MTATRTDRGSTDTTTIYSEGGDLVFERTFSATVDQVWKAFTDPTLVPRWWGPHGTTTVVTEMDVRPGGTWRYVARDADGNPIALLREWLADAGLACRRLQPLDLDGRHLLLAVATFDRVAAAA